MGLSREKTLQRGLAGYSPWGHKELNTTEQLNTRAHRFHRQSVKYLRRERERERTLKYDWFVFMGWVISQADEWENILIIFGKE